MYQLCHRTIASETMKTHNIDENKDRISDLPDCVLLLILSILNSKEAVQTCILSARWKNLWKYLPVLSLSSLHFKTCKSFNRFVSQILSLRDDKTALHTLNFHREGNMESRQLKRILKYAFDHSVQLLDVDSSCYLEHYPLPYVSYHTLTSLTLCANNDMIRSQYSPLFPTSLNFPALTSLCLKYFSFRGSGDYNRAEPFSTLKSLKSLIIHCCVAQYLLISSSTLVYLRIKTFSHHCCKIELSTPSLYSFDFEGNPIRKLSGSNNNLSSIKHVKIDVADLSCIKEYPLVLLNWLAELSLIESLTISSSTLKVL
jgi:hypothetical protein